MNTIRTKEQANAISQIWRDKNKDRHRENSKRWRLENRMRTLILHAKARSKTAGISFNLPSNHFENTPLVCVYCGRAIKFHLGQRQLDSVTLDRIEPTLGYTKQNTTLACWNCNRRKSDTSVSQLVALAATVKYLAIHRGIQFT